MDGNARARLAGKLLGLAKRALPITAQQLRIEFRDFGFDAEGLAQLDEVRDWLLRENRWGEKYSEKHLTAVLAGVIGVLRTTLDYQDALRAAVKLDQDWLALADVQLVYVPIENVQMTLFELKIGRTRITRVTPKLRREFEAGVRKALTSSKKTPDEVELFVGHQLERLDRLGEVVSIVEVNAEPVRAHEIALDETRRALDYLNYAATAISNIALRRAAGISGDAFRGVRSHLVVKSDFTHYSSAHDFGEGIAAVTLNGAFKKELPRLGYTKVSKMLLSPKPTDLEEAVIQALHWYSDSWVQSSLENELLGLVTALETFFTRGRGITSQLSEGVAFVLTQGLEHRKRIVRRIKYLYGLRGTVTHGRKQQILPAEVAELRFYVLNVINVMIHNPQKWQSLQAMHEWIEDQRLS